MAINIPRYTKAITRFASDLSIAANGDCLYTLADLQELIDNGDPTILRDIDAVNELDFNLRYGKVKIVAVEQ